MTARPMPADLSAQAFFASDVLRARRLTRLPGLTDADFDAVFAVVGAAGEGKPLAAAEGDRESCIGQAFLLMRLAEAAPETLEATALRWTVAALVRTHPEIAKADGAGHVSAVIGRAHPAGSGAFKLFAPSDDRGAVAAGGTVILRARIVGEGDGEHPEDGAGDGAAKFGLFLAEMPADHGSDSGPGLSACPGRLLLSEAAAETAFVSLWARQNMAVALARLAMPGTDLSAPGMATMTAAHRLGLHLVALWLAMHIDLAAHHQDRAQRSDSARLAALLAPALAIEAGEFALARVFRDETGALARPEPAMATALFPGTSLDRGDGTLLHPWWQQAVQPAAGVSFRPFAHPIDAFLDSLLEDPETVTWARPLARAFGDFQNCGYAMIGKGEKSDLRLLRALARQTALVAGQYLLMQTALVAAHRQDRANRRHAAGAGMGPDPGTIDWHAMAEDFAAEPLSQAAGLAASVATRLPEAFADNGDPL